MGKRTCAHINFIKNNGEILISKYLVVNWKALSEILINIDYYFLTSEIARTLSIYCIVKFTQWIYIAIPKLTPLFIALATQHG